MKIKNAVPFLISLLCFIGAGFIKINQKSHSLYFFQVGSDEIGFWLYLIGLFLMILGISAFFFQRETKKTTNIIGIILILLVLSASIFPTLYTVPTTAAWYEFDSPDQAHTIVVQEKAFLHSGGGTIYKKVSPHLLKKITDYRTDDGYTPFSHHNYKIDWQKDGATISYAWDSTDTNRFNNITISFSGENK